MRHILGETEARQDQSRTWPAPRNPTGRRSRSPWRSACVLLAPAATWGSSACARAASMRAEAEAHLATARTMLAELGMRFWLDQADAELAG